MKMSAITVVARLTHSANNSVKVNLFAYIKVRTNSIKMEVPYNKITIVFNIVVFHCNPTPYNISTLCNIHRIEAENLTVSAGKEPFIIPRKCGTNEINSVVGLDYTVDFISGSIFLIASVNYCGVEGQAKLLTVSRFRLRIRRGSFAAIALFLETPILIGPSRTRLGSPIHIAVGVKRHRRCNIPLSNAQIPSPTKKLSRSLFILLPPLHE